MFRHAGLIAAIRELANDAGRRGQLTVDLDLDPAAIGSYDELLFSCARELIANVVAHADATLLQISLIANHPHITLTVADNGIGITQIPPTQPGHLGLSTMTARIQDANGKLVLHPTDTGATIELRLTTHTEQVPQADRPPAVATTL